MEAPEEICFTSYMDEGDCSDSGYKNWLQSNCSFKKTVLWYLNHIHRSWSKACRRIQLDQEFLEALLSFHTREDNMLPLTKELVKRHILSLTRVYRDFAWQQPEFALLNVR